MTIEKEYSLFHGMRSKKSIEQLKKEGFCSYGSPVDEKREIVKALKYFNKEKILHQNIQKGELIRNLIDEIMEKHGKGRLSTYTTTEETASCNWWARANPEHISLTLSHAGISEENINKYLNERYGKNCYRVELKETSKTPNSNFNTNKRCIKPEEIKDIKKCKSCNYSFKEEKDNL